MSQMRNKYNGKWPTAADLENDFIKMENNLENMNKTFINKMLKTLNSIMVAVQHNESGVFNVILKWFRLYLNVHISINPDNKKLLKYYESSVPTIITYIIGCLQYKTKELPNYHYNLLEILEEILENVPSKILNEITKFEIGTIGCLWNPIDIAGDFNTQSKALKILSILLKQFDDVRQNEELKCIKWTNLNLFQDKLKIVVQESKLSYIQENSTRELLNNYNMNLSKNILVYSFCCTSAVMDNKYTFYKPLNLKNFWIDINYSPKTLSYKARFKLNSKSKYENIDVILKVQMMKLENNILLVYFKAPGEFSKYSKYFANITNNVIQFTLTNEEVQRLQHNSYIMEYFNSLNESAANVKPIKTYRKDNKTHREDQNIFDSLKNEMSTNLQENKNKMPTCNRGSNLFKKSYNFLIDSTPEQNVNPENTATYLKSLVESPKTSKNAANEMKKHPIRKLRNRKNFFTSLITDDTDDEIINKKTQRKKTKNRKPRQTKSGDKQICKVTPTVDLTKIENMESIKQNINVNTTHKDEIQKKCSPLIRTQYCAEVLKQVADIYDVGDTTYAKPCQSYRNFKTQPNPVSQITNIKSSTKARNRKKKVDKIDNESSVEKIRKLTNSYAEENKENINPQIPATDSKIPVLAKTKSIISPHLFETQCSDETPPTKKLPSTIKTNQNLDDAVDLTLDEQNQSNGTNNEIVSSCDSIECEEVRGINENSIKDLAYICTPTKSILYNSSEVNTPRPSCMNISDVNDSDMEITQVANTHNFIMDRLTENNHHEHNVVQQTNDLDMEIKHIFNANPNTIMERKNTANLQTDYENMEVPIYLEQILNDFEYNSDEKFDSIHKTQTKQTNVNVMAKLAITNDSADRDYYRDCVIFQKRIDVAEDSGSSEDDGHCNESAQCQKNSKINTNHNLAYLNQNLCQQNATWATPDKTNNISTNLTTTMATKCQVTPTAIIMHQIQVSAKKSVILRNKKPRKAIKANKSLNGYFHNINSNKELIELRKEAVALQNQNSSNFHERTSGNVLPLIDHKVSSYNTKHKPANLPIALHHQLSKLMNRNDTFNSTINANNLYETPSTNPPTQTQFNEDFEKSFEQRSSSCISNTTEEGENILNSNDNTLYNFIRAPIENAENSFKSDLLQILNDFNTNMQLRINNAHHVCLKNATALYNQKFCEIAQGVLKKSEEQRIELDEIHSNIGRLVRELEWQYDKFINKSKQFDVHKELTERVLESLTNVDIPNLITNDHEELIKQLNTEQNKLVQKVWQTYVEKHKT